MVVTAPVVLTRRAGSPRRPSQPGAAADLMIAEVLAAFASTQLAAATLAAAQQLPAGAPVRGSRMWCTGWSPLLHAREPLLDVARPPSRSATTG